VRGNIVAFIRGKCNFGYVFCDVFTVFCHLQYTGVE
jgi:hypothetical protein